MLNSVGKRKHLPTNSRFSILSRAAEASPILERGRRLKSPNPAAKEGADRPTPISWKTDESQKPGRRVSTDHSKTLQTPSERQSLTSRNRSTATGNERTATRKPKLGIRGGIASLIGRRSIGTLYHPEGRRRPASRTDTIVSVSVFEPFRFPRRGGALFSGTA